MRSSQKVVLDHWFIIPSVCLSGYAFLLFQEESSVQALIDACIEEDGKLYLCVSSPTIKDKPVRGLLSAPKNIPNKDIQFPDRSFLRDVATQTCPAQKSSLQLPAALQFSMT